MDLVVIFKSTATEDDLSHAVERMKAMGLEPSVSDSEFRTTIGVRCPDPSVAREQLEQLPGVDRVMSITRPYRLASREFHEADTILDIKGVRVGGPHVNVIAGPCAIENRDQLFEIASAVKEAGAAMLRGGAFKPRSSPYSFQGLGKEGLILLKEVSDALDIPTITEVTDPRDVDVVYQYADVFQVGARNLQNYNLLMELGRTDKPVFIKRGLAASIEELLMAAEYVLSRGNHRVLVCERGIRTFSTEVRFTLDVSAVPVIQQLSHLPVFVDPSHAAGRRDLVIPLALAAIAAGASGVIVEVHHCPEKALCDGPQALLPADFAKMMDQIRQIAEVVGNRVTAWGDSVTAPRRSSPGGWMS